jgi:hypothetical protein
LSGKSSSTSIDLRRREAALRVTAKLLSAKTARRTSGDASFESGALGFGATGTARSSVDLGLGGARRFKVVREFDKRKRVARSATCDSSWHRGERTHPLA